MHIAVYMPSAAPAASAWRGGDWFAHEVLKSVLALYPGHTFDIYSGHPPDSFPGGFPHAKHVPLQTPRRNAFLLRYIQDRKLSSLLKKYPADAVLSMDGFIPAVPVPTCLVLQDMPVIANTASAKGASMRRGKRRLQACLSQAGTVAAVSEYDRKELISCFSIPEGKITAVHRGVHESFHPLDWEARELVKNDYADGREYLLYSGEISRGRNIVNLLKAFSILKKRFRSGMVLVLAGTLDARYKEFPELLRTYHFRDDVKLAGQLQQPEIARLTGGAYALICPSAESLQATAIPEALTCGVPVLAADHDGLKEAAGDAALYFDPAKAEEMGDMICEVYKNENLRGRLIASSGIQAAGFSWDKTAARLWSCLEHAASAGN